MTFVVKFVPRTYQSGCESNDLKALMFVRCNDETTFGFSFWIIL